MLKVNSWLAQFWRCAKVKEIDFINTMGAIILSVQARSSLDSKAQLG